MARTVATSHFVAFSAACGDHAHGHSLAPAFDKKIPVRSFAKCLSRSCQDFAHYNDVHEQILLVARSLSMS